MRTDCRWTPTAPTALRSAMFTGIVERQGRVHGIQPTAHGATVRIDPLGWSYRPTLGDSVAVNGCCLTVSAVESGDADASVWHFDVIPQTLAMTTIGSLRPEQRVNMESAATPTTLLGGHLVQGHVDGIGRVESIVTDGEWRVRIAPPPALMPLLSPQGSVTIEGVSLTVASVAETWFEIALIPTTLERTTLSALCVGALVNIETDALARAVERLLVARGVISARA